MKVKQIKLSGAITGTILALAALWAAPAAASCIAGVSCGSSPPPPIVQQQIVTASTPISLPPPPPSPRPAFGGSAATSAALSATLDGGLQDWLKISPYSGFDRLPAEPLTAVGTIQAASHERPVPQSEVVPFDQYLSMEKPVLLRPDGILGVGTPTPAAAARALWFVPENAR